MRKGFSVAALALALAGAPAVISAPIEPASGEAEAAGAVLFASPDLRIVRIADRQGRQVLLLTNVDAAGAYFPGRQEEPERRVPAPPEETRPASAPAVPATTRIVIRRGTADETGEETIEVASAAEGGTTIVLELDGRSGEPSGKRTPPPCPVAPIVVAPWTVVGGLPGAFRYPDRLPFLGYGPTNATPSMFGGLGLNAGNRFGLTGAAPCGEGFDCMFAPGTRRP